MVRRADENHWIGARRMPVVRTSISVPGELKARMDAHGKGIGWSAVACVAFESKLAEIIARKGAKNMEDAVLRLRASKLKSDDATYNRGVEDGRTWAMNYAEAAELERLAKFKEVEESNTSWPWGTWFECDLWKHQDHATALYYIINPSAEEADEPREVRGFWEVLLGETDLEEMMGSPSYLKGFCDGALAVWEEVEDKL
jgi:hypothetical protein